MTVYYYLSKILGWPEAKINFVEVMLSQTNEFRYGLIEEAILDADFLCEAVTEWKTIESGMSRLPEAMAKVIGERNIALQTPVESLAYLEDGRVEVGYGQKPTCETFDAVILALPPSAIHMIPNKPQWPVSLEHALRSIHFQPLYKMGLRFKSRFWENKHLRASKGGQSRTDLPCRWVVYPSHGIGDTGKGVLLVYNWRADSSHWISKSKVEKINLALHNLQELYPEVDVYSEYAGSESDEAFIEEAVSVEWPSGDTVYYAGQFSSLYPTLKQAQGNIYFAGEHLSVYQRWMVGALDSAKDTVHKLLFNYDLNVEYLS